MFVKNEQQLREAEIADTVRSEINLAVQDYRRRTLNVLPELVDEFRAKLEKGKMPAIDDKYRKQVRAKVREQ